MRFPVVFLALSLLLATLALIAGIGVWRWMQAPVTAMPAAAPCGAARGDHRGAGGSATDRDAIAHDNAYSHQHARADRHAYSPGVARHLAPGRAAPRMADLEQLRPGHAGHLSQLLRQRSRPGSHRRGAAPFSRRQKCQPGGTGRVCPGTGATQRRCWVNGDDDLLRRLLAAGVPVLVETWHEDAPNDGLGHYRLLVGYDAAAQHWIAYDSYDRTGLIEGDGYQGIRLPFDRFAPWWQVFNRTFLLVYPPDRTAEVDALLAASGAAPGTMWVAAAARAQAELMQEPGNAFAWFKPRFQPGRAGRLCRRGAGVRPGASHRAALAHVVVPVPPLRGVPGPGPRGRMCST
jgi:hypothetical protein